MPVIGRLARFLFPRRRRLFDLLEEVAAEIRAAAAAFAELGAATTRGGIEAIAGRLKPIETDADSVCRRLYEEADRSFVTPIDREDVGALAKALDDVVDGMEHTAAFAALYRLDRLTDPMRELVRITVAAAGAVAGAVALLRRSGDPDCVRAATGAVHALENEADAVYRRAVAALFAGGAEPSEVIRQADVLFDLEHTVDRCQDAVDVIRSVIGKNG